MPNIYKTFFVAVLLISMGIILVLLKLAPGIDNLAVALVTLGLSTALSYILLVLPAEKKLALVESIINCGIENIFKNRHQAVSNVLEYFEEALHKGGNVKIMAVSGTQFFFPNAPFEEAFLKLLTSKIEPQLSVQVLLIDPFSVGGMERIIAERNLPQTTLLNRQQIEESLLFKRWAAACEIFNNWRGVIQGNVVNLEYRFYSSSAVMYLIRFNDALFVEQYHNGPIDFKGLLVLGGRVPMIQYKSNSEAFKFYDKHFDFFFKRAVNICPSSTL